tara:strand:+ start:6611 stop:8032 length:1422 start_codon:yes stop_codon:yes gene_type:complete
MGFGLVSIVAVIMCGMLIGLLGDVSSLVDEMSDDDAASKNALALATSIREQYIHQAHWPIERNDKHLHHDEDWAAIVAQNVEALRPRLPSQSVALDSVAQGSLELDRLFKNELQNAASAGDVEKVVAFHMALDAIARRATSAADSIAQSVDARVEKAHRAATSATTTGLTAGVLCISVVFLLSLYYIVQLRRSVVVPLGVLARAAQDFGAGSFDSRVGTVGEGELQEVADAFDTMAEELEAREHKLIAGERMAAIGQLAAGVAHEINNPIQVIRGYLKTMTPDSSRESIDEELLILDEEAAACQRIAEDLLTYSHSPALEMVQVNMRVFLTDASVRFRETPEGHEHGVRVHAEQGVVFADPARLRQVLMNLIVNAAQVSKQDKPILVLGQTRGSDGYEVSILDEGPGIRADDKDRIFEPFFTKRSGGTGLGLAVSAGLVHAHGGTITVEDRVGGGSVFTIVLPAAPGESVAEA